MAWDVDELDERLVGDDVQLDGRQEAQSAVREGDGREKLGVRVLRSKMEPDQRVAAMK